MAAQQTGRQVIGFDVAGRCEGWVSVTEKRFAGGAHPLNTGAQNTTAFQAAIDYAAGAGVEVYVPAGAYRVLHASASEVLRITGPVTIRGAGQATTLLVVDSAVPGTADVLHYVAASSAGHKHFRLSSLGIVPQSGTPGRYAINVDTTTGSIADMVIERIYTEQLGSGSFTNTNPALTDGWFTSTIRNCFFVGGIILNRAGDSIRIENNTITGNGIGIDWDAVIGTNVGLIAGNNITSKSSAIRLRSAYRTIIRDNNIEPYGGGGYDGAPSIDVSGSVADVYETRIVGNTILASLESGTDAISFDHALNPWVGPNTIYVAGAGRGVVTTANTVGLKIDITASAWAAGPTQLDDGSGSAQVPVYVPHDAAGTIRLGETVRIGTALSSGTYAGALVVKGTGGITQTIYGNGAPPRLAFVQEGVGSFSVAFAAAAPASGTWAAGDVVFNAAPAVGQPKGWRCTVGGTPGTWVSEGNL